MLLRPVPPQMYHREPVPHDADVSLRYLGTAGFVVEGAGRTVVIDPYVTRPGLWETAAKRLKPNRQLIHQLIPHADDVIIGHSHHDHVLDAPDLCIMTGARFIGSPSACNVARAGGVPEAQIVETTGHRRIIAGDATICGIPSLHGKIYGGRIPLPGVIPVPPPWPPRYSEQRCGLVLNWHIEMAGMSVVHIDSADLIESHLQGYQADVLCLCAIGRRYRKDYARTAIEMLKPRYVIACHWDWFFTDYHAEPLCLPGVNLPGFLKEISDAGATPVVLPFEGRFGVNVARLRGQAAHH